MLLDRVTLEARRAAAEGPLSALAQSLRAELTPLLDRGPWMPAEKARMTRASGRCARDGTMLEFDPFSPRTHVCPTCRTGYDGEEHYRWWVMWYQLWFAERITHAAMFGALLGDAQAATFARHSIALVTATYDTYPNVDNVLGPTRPFFSTYLESIWLLQLCVASSLLDLGNIPYDRSGFFDRVVVPSSTLIASFDEGLSNRQVWNNAALAAAARLTDDRRLFEHALYGQSGLLRHLTDGLLPDGTWYEGENYHLFAHRGLWYLMSMAEAARDEIPSLLRDRFQEAFATPFLTALPDFTFPARRDSQYAVSLRQWRFAELAELGLARAPGDGRLLGALNTLYDSSAPEGDTARSRSTAEAERNGPGVRLARTDLGWRSLLFALPELPPLSASTPPSIALAGQGFAIVRRDAGVTYVALDYGHSGGGHGHPDRLNLWLVTKDARWLDDMGTGSYVDPSLHWYRSTLAHNAPVVDGRSQRPARGVLLAWDERGGAGWVEARVDDAAAGTGLLRTIVVMPDYVLDRVIWWSGRERQVDLPMHLDASVEGVEFTPADAGGDDGLEDGFRWLCDVERARIAPDATVTLDAMRGGQRLQGFIIPSTNAELWRAVAPGPPGKGSERFHFVRQRAPRGTFVTVWSWREAVQSVIAERSTRDRRDAIVVRMKDGTVHTHERSANGWRVGFQYRHSTSSVELTGRVDETLPEVVADETPHGEPYSLPLSANEQEVAALEFELEGASYRRSEVGWREAGSPRAVVGIYATAERFFAEVSVSKQPLAFVARMNDNPLDNEHPDINSDGVQLHVLHQASGEIMTWILVPELEGGVRVTARGTRAADVGVDARWRMTDAGYDMRIGIPLEAAAPNGRADVDVIVNEIAPGRERRRGQLAMSGGGGWTYLRGDRADRARLVSFVVGQP